MKYVLLILLTACSVTPPPMTPEQARAYGVDVPDGSEITGTVVSSEFKWIGTCALAKACGGDYGMDACTVGVSQPWPDPNHEYKIYYADTRFAHHEAAHAYYEIWSHTIAWNLSTMW